MALTRIDSYLVDLDSLGGITFDDQAGTPTFKVDATTHRVGIGTASPKSRLDIIFDADSGIKFDTVPDSGGTLITSYHGTNNNNVRQLQIDAQRFLVNTGNPQGTSTTNALFIESNGNVGIGTDDPQEKLQVQGDVRLVDNSPRIGFHDANASTNIQCTGGIELFDQNGNRGAYMGATEGSNFLSFGISPSAGANPTEKLRITSTGNVGIGTDNPQNKLHVIGSIEIPDNLVLKLGSYGGSEHTIRYSTPTQPGMMFRTAGTDRMIITSGGFVGIGTNNPASKLDVNTGLGRVSITSSGSGGSRIIFSQADGTSRATIHNYGGAEEILAYDASSNHQFLIGNSPKVIINSSGNFGIGTMNPQTKLDVRGYIISSVNNTGVESGLYLGNSNHGLRRAPSTNDVYLYTIQGNLYLGSVGSSSKSITIGSNENVGIGTDNPVAKLQIESPNGTGQNGGIILRETGNQEHRIWVDNAHQYNSINSSSGTWTWDSSGVVAKLTTAGLGIGTDTVEYRVDVYEPTGTNASQALVRFRKDHTQTSVTGSTGGSNQYPHALCLENQDTSADVGTVSLVLSKLSNSGAQSQVIIAGMQESPGNMSLTLNTESSNIMGERLRVTSTGNVGIGTTNPIRKLHLYGTQSALRFTNTDTGSWAGLEWSVANGAYSAYSGLLDSNGRYFIDVGSNGDDLTILQNGNVGIGVTNPQTKLNVIGTISTGRNLARELGTVVDYSTQFSTSRSASNVINGEKNHENSGRDWLTVGYNRTNAYVTIDLGTSYTVDRLVVYNQNEYPDSKREVKQFTLQGSNDNSTWTTIIVNECGKSNATEPNPGWSFRIPDNWADDDEGRTWRYWKFIMNTFHGDDPYGGVMEIELYEANDTLDDEVSTSSLVSQDVYSETGNFGRGITVGYAYGGENSVADGAIIEGNVGIGTDNPQSKLDVHGNIYVDSSGGITNRYIYLRNQSTEGSIRSDKDLSLWSGDGNGTPTKYLTIAQGGNVGIGTTNPVNKLQIQSALTSTLSTLFSVGSASSGRGTITFNMSDSTGGGDIIQHVKEGFISKNTYGLIISSSGTLSGSFTGAGPASIRFYYPSAGGGSQAGGQLEFWTRQNGFSGGYVEEQRMIIDNYGNVGIGATTPQGKLSIWQETGSILKFRKASDFDGNFVGHAIDSRNEANTVSTTLLYRGSPHIWWGDAGVNEIVRFTGTGNVGIGTNNPRTVLEIRGDHISTTDTVTPVLRLSTGNSYAGNNTGSALEFGTTNSTYPTWVKGRIGCVYNGSSNYGGHLVFQTNTGSGATTISEKVRITDAGNVGIGTTNPQHTLQVQGDCRVVNKQYIGNRTCIKELSITTSSNSSGVAVFNFEALWEIDDSAFEALATIDRDGSINFKTGRIKFYGSKISGQGTEGSYHIEHTYSYTGTMSFTITHNNIGSTGHGTTIEVSGLDASQSYVMSLVSTSVSRAAYM